MSKITLSCHRELSQFIGVSPRVCDILQNTFNELEHKPPRVSGRFVENNQETDFPATAGTQRID